MTFLGIAVIFGGTFLFFHSTDARIQEEAQAHIDKILSLSGKLTDAEKQIFIAETQALIKLLEPYYTDGDNNLPFVSDAELARLQQHTIALRQENPDLAIHAHGPGEPHQTDQAESQVSIQAELATVNATIEEVKASNVSAAAKEALLSILEHRQFFLMNQASLPAELEAKLRELSEADPNVIGVTKSHITGEYTPQYPNMLELTIHQYTREDGTTGDMYLPAGSHASDPEVAELLIPYLEALDTLPPWEAPPVPEHKDLRVTFKYAANYPKENRADIASETPEESPENLAETAEEPSTETDTPAEAYPDPIITAEEVEEWREVLAPIQESTDPEMLDIRKLFEAAIGIPLDRFMEMTDAEIEAEFSKYFSDAEVEKRATAAARTDMSLEESFGIELRSQFPAHRVNHALQTLIRYGPEEGLSRVKAVDPEISTHIERIIQRQKDQQREQ